MGKATGFNNKKSINYTRDESLNKTRVGSSFLSKIAKKFLGDRKIIIENSNFAPLTGDELFLIDYHIRSYHYNTINMISERYHIDFDGWDKPEYNDLLICNNKR